MNGSWQVSAAPLPRVVARPLIFRVRIGYVCCAPPLCALHIVSQNLRLQSINESGGNEKPNDNENNAYENKLLYISVRRDLDP